MVEQTSDREHASVLRRWFIDAAEVLLLFAIRLYTRLNPEGEGQISLHDFRERLPVQSWWVDNGKRGIKVELTHGPYWSDEDGI